MASSVARRKVVERVSARVFCHLEEGGGNPVTVFSSASALTDNTKEKLAQQCDWESVVVQYRSNSDNQKKNNPPLVSFYMPSGEPVSFCAHAAMGAALEIRLATQEEEEEEDEVTFSVADWKNLDQEQDYHTTMYEGDIVALEMNAIYQQTPISQPSLLARVLRENCGLDVRDLASTPDVGSLLLGDARPILCHASIARPKTLIPVRSMEDLHNKAVAPKDPDGFARSCKALDDTTGLYLYSKSEEEDGAWECRQFPRASGYPEDPATGIAAGALACYLYHHHGLDLPAYKFYQGTAMGKPSLIVVDNLMLEAQQQQQKEEAEKIHASFRLLGRVEIDSRDSIEVEDDEE